MKTPVAKQLPSGSWYVRVRVDGEDVSITKPTEKEAVAEAMGIKSGLIKIRKSGSITLTKAIDKYLDARSNVISVSTIRGYRFIQKGRFKTMMKKDLTTITQKQWQTAVNAEAKLCSAKTLQNAWRFISSVITEETGDKVNVRLPMVKPNTHAFLSSSQIPVFVNAVHNTSVEIPALLALCSLRRSEILDLKWTDVDLDNKLITVSGSAVFDENSQLVHKAENKNGTSTRIVPMIPQLAEALSASQRTSEYVVTMSPAGMYKHINTICEANNLPKVGIHGLRHSCASIMYALNIPTKIAMEIGGWSNDQTMTKIYTHVSQKEIADHAKDFTNFFVNFNNTKNDDNNDDEKR